MGRKQYQHSQGERNHEQREQERERNHEQSSSSSSSSSNSDNCCGSSSVLFPRRHRPIIRLREVLVKEVGEHVHYDNLKLVSFVPSSSLSNNHHNHNHNSNDNYVPPSQPPRSIAVSRSYDSRIYFQSIPF